MRLFLEENKDIKSVLASIFGQLDDGKKCSIFIKNLPKIYIYAG